MTALTKIENFPDQFSNEKLELLKNTVCRGASNDEFQLFLHVCKKTGLDPFMKQIYSIPRGGQRTIQTSIDGLRLIAERTGRYSPGKETVYKYDDKNNLFSATAYIKKMTADGTWHEVSATAIFSEYTQGNNPFWKRMGHVMLGKCAEALALRKAFPAEMSGVYSDDEMNQASSEPQQVLSIQETKVNEDQLEELNTLLEQLPNGKQDMLRFLELNYKIFKLEDIPEKMFNRLVITLKMKIDKLNEDLEESIVEEMG